jgi:uncharacterized repeat protein (TIGR02543 family)
VDADGTFAEYSNYGDSIDYSAPGYYKGKTGTSYAAAYYSGVLAEVLSKGLEKEFLDSYAADFGEEGWDRYYGTGVVTLSSFADRNLIQEVFGDGWEEMGDSFILKMGDFHNLTNAKIDSYVRQSDLADVGYYLSGLSDSDRKELLERDTILTQKVSFCKGIFSGETLTEGSAMELNEKEDLLYYEKCLAEYEKESAFLRTSATYLHETGFFYLSFKDETGAGLSTTYQICARVSYKDPSSKNTVGGTAKNQKITNLGNNSYSITVWSNVCTGGSDTMKLQWDGSQGYYARFLADDRERAGRIFVPMIRVQCPAYTLMYKAEMSHAASGMNCSGRGNFFQYSKENDYTYVSNRNKYQLRKYGMLKIASSQLLAPQINASHMNLADTSQASTSSVSTHCTMYVYLNQPTVSLTINPNGEKWAGTAELSSLQVVNAQITDLGKTTATNYKATFYGGGDAADPVVDCSVTTDKAFSYWALSYAANGSGQHGTLHSCMVGTTFAAGSIEYDQNSSSKPTNGEKVTATAVFSGSLTILFPAAPVRTGYTFAGWYTGAVSGAGTLACSRENAGKASVTLSSDTEYHAEWIKNQYTVSYYSGGSLLASQSYPYRTDIDLSESELRQDENGSYYEQQIAPEKSVRVENGEYLLVGWSLAEGGPVVSSVNVPANNSTCLYAVWSRPTSGMKQVVFSVQSGENKGLAVIGTEGTASVNLTLGLKAFFYQADIPLYVTGSGISITPDGYSYAEDNAGNKTPLSAAAVLAQLPVQYRFIYKFYVYNVNTDCWDYLENKDTWETADVFAGETYDYICSEEHFCETPYGYLYEHAEYAGITVELPYTIRVTGKENDENTIRTIDIYFYPVTCTLTFDANGGTFLTDGLGELYMVSEHDAIAQRTVLYGACIGSFPGVEKGAFYGCTGFYDDSEHGSMFHTYDTVNGDMVLYAQWEVKSGTVRYDAGGNLGTIEGAEYLDTLVPYESEVCFGDFTAERAQYEFLGWSVDAQNTPQTQGVETLKPASDTLWMQSEALTLYAQFARKIHVRFHQWNLVEEASRKDGGEPVLYNNEKSVAVTAPSIQPYDNWEALGWSGGTLAAGSYEIGEQTEFVVEDDCDYYAIYRRAVTISYDSGFPEEEIGFYAVDMENAYISTDNGEALPAEFVIRAEPNREYYTFLYWKGDDGKRYDPGDSYTSVDDLTLTAVWAAGNAVVVYDAGKNGGTIDGMDEETVPVEYGSEIPADTTTYAARKEGYQFLGWNTDPDARGGLPVNPDVDAKVMEDGVLTLYAIFQKEVCASFYQQGETEAFPVTGMLYNNEQTVTVHAPSIAAYDGWNPLGWTTGTAADANVELCSESDFELSADVSFYALYEKPVTLTYDTGIKSIELGPCHGYAYHTTCESEESPDVPAQFTVSGMMELERRSFLNWEDTEGTPYVKGDTITLCEDMLLCANWDEYPEITALDRYFTLEQAVDENGTYINPEALLDPEYVTATDREDADQTLTVRLLGYYEEEFRTLTGSAELMIFFQTKDSFGHISTASATVHVVDTAGKTDPVTKEVRFLSSAYYQSDGEYLPEEKGGLKSSSLWKTDEELADCLSRAIQNTDAKDHTVRYHSYFTMEDVREIQQMLLEEDGFGKYWSADAWSD